MKNTIIGLLLFFTWISTQAQNIEGTWNGVLKINDISLRIVFHIEKNGDTYSTKMDSPDQGDAARGITGGWLLARIAKKSFVAQLGGICV